VIIFFLTESPSTSLAFSETEWRHWYSYTLLVTKYTSVKEDPWATWLGGKSGLGLVNWGLEA
jgi:hypothetical protein